MLKYFSNTVYNTDVTEKVRLYKNLSNLEIEEVKQLNNILKQVGPAQSKVLVEFFTVQSAKKYKINKREHLVHFSLEIVIENNENDHSTGNYHLKIFFY